MITSREFDQAKLEREAYAQLFIRASRDLKHAEELLSELDQYLDCEMEGLPVRVLSFPKGDDWTNGMVLRVALVDLDAPARELKRMVTKAEAWALYKGSQCVEYPLGPMSGFLASNATTPISQMFLRLDREAKRDGSSLEQIRAELEKHQIAAKPVFHLRDGVVFFVATTQPAKIVLRRCQTAAERLPDFLFINPDGETFNIAGRQTHDSWPEYFEQANQS